MRVITSVDIGRLVREIRKKSKLTQAQLAAASGVGARFIRELEKGKETCQLEKVLLIIQMLGIKLEAMPPVIEEQ